MSNLTEIASTLADPFVSLYRLPVEVLREKLKAAPSLARANDRGRNLICAAAIALDIPRLRLLLEFGADIEAKDAGGHTPLYRVADSRSDEKKGQTAIALLIGQGANVNQVTGVGGITPLHMSARRGTTGIAEALLNAGADIEARDKKGETPLRRAVNCGQERMVCLLLSRGADRNSTDKKGRTPIDAARSENVRKLIVNESDVFLP